jgi:hypothetical protein
MSSIATMTRSKFELGTTTELTEPDTGSEKEPSGSSVRERWIDALLSGHYKQGRSALRIEDRYCCLGVLTELYLQDHPRANPSVMNGCVLTQEVRDWAGLKSIGGNVADIQGFHRDKAGLAFLNDDDIDFQGIAGLLASEAGDEYFTGA